MRSSNLPVYLVWLDKGGVHKGQVGSVKTSNSNCFFLKQAITAIGLHRAVYRQDDDINVLHEKMAYSRAGVSCTKAGGHGGPMWTRRLRLSLIVLPLDQS